MPPANDATQQPRAVPGGGQGKKGCNALLALDSILFELQLKLLFEEHSLRGGLVYIMCKGITKL